MLANIEGKREADKISFIAKVIQKSEKAVYNKCRGLSKFTIEEFIIIAQKSGTSLDQIVLNSNVDKSYIPFYSDGIKYTPRAFHEYIQNINQYFNKIKHFENVQGYFLANELPLFHFLGFPQLMYLKLYIWNTINWQIQGRSLDYNPDILNQMPEFGIQSNNLMDSYRSFNSSELWNPSILHNTLEQWRHLRSKGVIQDKKMIEGCRYELNKVIENLERITETGKKPTNRKGISYDCNIYLTGLNMGSEVIIVKSDTNTMLFQQLDVPNYLRTTNHAMIAQSWNYYNNIKKTATSITGSGDKEKTILFQHLRESVDRCMV